MSSHETGVSEYARDLLSRPTVGQVRFSDVYPEVAALDDPLWWSRTDYDAALTDRVESNGFSGVERIPIGLRPWMTSYGLLLTDDLVIARNERIDNLVEEGGVLLDHPDVKKERAEREGAVIVLGNKAHRDKASIADGKNGSNFYLAITEAGTELYVTPTSFLVDLDAKDRIVALYEIPNKDHPEFNGDKEQFRSARVNRTRRHPDHLVRVYDYEGDREALRQAKEDGTHREVIPADNRSGRIAHVDTYGNTLIWQEDASAAFAARIGQVATLSVKSPEWPRSVHIETTVVEDLKSGPSDELVVYTNCSTHQDERVRAGIVEFVSRVDDDPNTSENTAFPQLLRRIEQEGLPPLDVARAEITLQEGRVV